MAEYQEQRGIVAIPEFSLRLCPFASFPNHWEISQLIHSENGEVMLFHKIPDMKYIDAKLILIRSDKSTVILFEHC